LEDPALELELETATNGPAGEKAPELRRPFDAMHFLLTPFLTLGVPQAGTLLPPTRGKPTEARKSGAVT
jgi:hypothetical protein